MHEPLADTRTVQICSNNWWRPNLVHTSSSRRHHFRPPVLVKMNGKWNSILGFVYFLLGCWQRQDLRMATATLESRSRSVWLVTSSAATSPTIPVATSTDAIRCDAMRAKSRFDFKQPLQQAPVPKLEFREIDFIIKCKFICIRCNSNFHISLPGSAGPCQCSHKVRTTRFSSRTRSTTRVE